jgi:transcription-repair coupling factor (superfamily II helicase)
MKSLYTLLEKRIFESFVSLDFHRRRSHYVSGLEGSSLSALVAAQYLELKENQTPVLVIMRDVKSAEILIEDLRSWLGEDEVLYFPGLDLKPYEWRSPFGQITEQRLQCYDQLLKGKRRVVVTTLSAFMFKLISPEFFRREILILEKKQEIDLEDMRETLIHMGFIEESIVEDMGQFSIRGGILDIYPFLIDNPVRLELGGDEIDSIREFDIFSQRSIKELEKVEIFPYDECCFSKSELEDGLLAQNEKFPDESAFEAEIHRLVEKRDRTGLNWQKPFFSKDSYLLTDFMQNPPLIVLDQKEELAGKVQNLVGNMENGFHEAYDKGRFVASPAELMVSPRALDECMEMHMTIFIGKLEIDAPGYHAFNFTGQTSGGGNLNSIMGVFQELRDKEYQILLMSPNPGQAERLQRLTQDSPVTEVLVGNIASGFISHDDRVALFTDHQIFNRFSRSMLPRKHRGGGVAIPNFEALNRGDLIVHQEYGIGRYLGIKRVRIEDHAIDCILLQYRDNDRLTIPVADLKKIQKYASEEGAAPRLSRLGGKSWEQLKMRTRKSIIKLAKDLIDLYARRSAVKGFVFSRDTPLQKEFEDGFIYNPTPDQITASKEIKADMQKPKPMDRLVCGDVGFGKTEIAMRAAMKAVLDKKQVAMLAPTTVLVSQHHASFLERFSNWPISIDFLNRFKSAKEEKETLDGLQKGGIDILIGTHRLLSKDVVFKNLGLIIVDEEQKFGVKQKERLKKIRTEVDVVSLSATPIPRSLHMSLVGARDFSVILTPPETDYLLIPGL